MEQETLIKSKFKISDKYIDKTLLFHYGLMTFIWFDADKMVLRNPYFPFYASSCRAINRFCSALADHSLSQGCRIHSISSLDARKMACLFHNSHQYATSTFSIGDVFRLFLTKHSSGRQKLSQSLLAAASSYPACSLCIWSLTMLWTPEHVSERSMSSSKYCINHSMRGLQRIKVDWKFTWKTFIRDKWLNHRAKCFRIFSRVC